MIYSGSRSSLRHPRQSSNQHRQARRPHEHPGCCQPLAWMETILQHPSSNGTNDDLVGAHKIRLNTSPAEQESNAHDSSITSSVTSPPYWVQSHQRSFSNISVESVPDGAITLQDNTDEGDSKNKACWARSVYIEDFVIVNGSMTNIGAFVVWNITVETLHVSYVMAGSEKSAHGNRAAQCAFENDTRNSTTFMISCFKRSQTRQLRCHRYPERASSPSFGRSFLRIDGLGYNTSSSRCCFVLCCAGLRLISLVVYY